MVDNFEHQTMHKLLIKQHNKTGLKYLCYTQKVDHDTYRGSGLKWKRHIQKYGYDVTTSLIFETTCYDTFIEFAKSKSIEYDIVNSNEWANLRLEEGTGGDTVSNKIWITDGNVDKYHPKNEDLPDGWVAGRSNCVFKNAEFQRELSKRADPKNRSIALKKAWSEGRVKRDHTKCGKKGDENVAKRPSVRKKMSEAAKRRPLIKCPKCGKEGQASPGMYRFHMENCIRE